MTGNGSLTDFSSKSKRFRRVSTRAGFGDKITDYAIKIHDLCEANTSNTDRHGKF